ncbi:hypothetical protein AAFM46_11020 [Arthrobacter sp. TMP15]|uniref:hypothetical protein n=1 Tax=Arthrobacter sp. TMP15 TaxID=3140789 RepID=UPI0031BB1CFB
MVDRYGAEIEADFHREYSLDLLDFFRGKHSWRKLRILLDRLPGTSLLRESIANDDEVAARIMADMAAAKKSAPSDPGPRVSEYSPEVQRLDELVDKVTILTTTVVGMLGGKPRPGRPAKRPQTAFTRARQALAMARHRSLLNEVADAQARWSERHQK